jgi:hypothetical protein
VRAKPVAEGGLVNIDQLCTDIGSFLNAGIQVPAILALRRRIAA